MNINQCQRIAEDLVNNGDEPRNIRFQLVGPKQALMCCWLDPHMGIFQLAENHDNKFLMVRDFELFDNIECDIL